MGLLSSSVSVSQYEVAGVVPATNSEDWITAQLARFGFKPSEDVVSETVSGWVALEDLHDGSFANRQTFIRPPYVCFSWRRDERKVPASVLKMEVDRQCKRWMADNAGSRFVPKGRKSEIKEMVHHALLARTLAVPSVLDAIWNLETKTLWLASISPKVTDAFSEAFKETFEGLDLRLVYPYARARRVVDRELMGVLAQYNKAGSDQALDEIQDNLWLGEDFLLWLVYNTMEADSVYGISRPGPALEGERFVSHIDSRLTLFGEEGEGTQKIVVTGPQERFTEVRTALSRGKRIQEATIYFEKDEDVWKLTLKGPTFYFGALKSPKVKMERDETISEMDETEGFFYERMHMLESAMQMFDSLFTNFLDVRLTKKWPALTKKIKEWIANEG
jgi:hypothetical protein